MHKQYLNPKALSFLKDLSLLQLNQILDLTVQRCQKCLVRKKNHYCMELECSNKQLICWHCDVNSIHSKHYLHEFSYVVPLFSKQIFTGLIQMKKNFAHFQEQLGIQIMKVKQYVQKLQKIEQIVKNQLKKLQKQQLSRNYDVFRNRASDLFQNFKTKKLSDLFKDVSFMSSQQCFKKQDELRRQLLVEIDNLKWLNDPQKQLKLLLKFQPPQDIKDAFLSSKKILQISQIDNYFRLIHQYYTETFATHKIQLKIQNQLSNKYKFYQAFIYHFKDCQNLTINNGNINHIRTPLTFRNLKFFEFNCNIESQNLNTKLQNLSNKLVSFSLKKFRQEDIKILKYITNNCNNLKQLNLQIYNKGDLSNYKQLIQYLKSQCLKQLTKFTLKIRTQSQVKRLYGYLSKFCKQSETSTNLNNCLIQFLSLNKSLTKVYIEGLKPLDSNEVLNQLLNMPYLMWYRVYYDNIDMMEQLENQKVKILENLCQNRRRLFFSYAKNLKKRKYSKNVMMDVLRSIYFTKK